jgi:hypothetical protein
MIVEERKIGWQTYQDLLEKQINSPMLNTLLDNLSNKIARELIDDDGTMSEDERYDAEQQLGTVSSLPISDQMIQDMAMLENYDCWIGHCNFDITPDIMETLDSTPGIEVLKIISRYRFFVGIGKMFEFKSVRKHISKTILHKEEED